MVFAVSALGWVHKEHSQQKEGQDDQQHHQIVAQLLARAIESSGGKESQECCQGLAAGSAAGHGKAIMSCHEQEQHQKRQFQQWLHQHGNCLYPSRDQKERLAEQMGTSYGKVNKLFANHRRRQHKHKAIAAQQQQQSQQIADKENQQQHLTEGERIEQTVEDIWSKVTGQQQQRHQSIGGGSAEMGPFMAPGGFAMMEMMTRQQQMQQAAQTAHGQQSLGQFVAVPSQFTPPPSVQPTPQPPLAMPSPADWFQLLASARHQQPAHPQHLFANGGNPLLGPVGHAMAKGMAPQQPNPLLLAALAQAQQQQLAQQQQMAMMKAAIEKEIIELLNAAKSGGQQNIGLLAQHSQLLDQIGQMQQQGLSPLMAAPPAMGGNGNGNGAAPSWCMAPLPLTFSPANSNANGSCGSPPSSACSESSSSLVALEEEPLDGLVDLDLIEKQIAAQHNGLTAAEAEAVAVLAGLAAQGGVGR